MSEVSCNANGLCAAFLYTVQLYSTDIEDSGLRLSAPSLETLRGTAVELEAPASRVSLSLSVSLCVSENAV